MRREIGDIIELGGTSFLILDYMGGVDAHGRDETWAFLLMCEPYGSCPFSHAYESPQYRYSMVQERCRDWLSDWVGQDSVMRNQIQRRVLDFRGDGLAMDQMMVRAAPLTVQEFHRYRHLLQGSDRPCWLAGNADRVDGDLTGYVYDSKGVRPVPVRSEGFVVPAVLISSSLFFRELLRERLQEVDLTGVFQSAYAKGGPEFG